MKSVGWGILGTGVVANEFVEGLKVSSGAKLRAVGSRSADKSAQFAQRHGIEKSYTSYLDVVTDPGVDIVYISTPNHLHCEHTLLCLQHGKAVLCEKPFALNAAEAKRVVDAARAASVFCMEGMWMRFMPLVQDLRARVREGLIGRPVLLAADFGVPTLFDASNRFFSKELGGGALLDRGVYPVSLAFFLFGPPSRVVAASALAPTGVDDSTAVILQYEGGAMAVLNSSLSAQYANAATVFGDLGQLTLLPPFYAPEEMTISLHGGARPLATTPSARSRAAAMVKRAPMARVFARRLRALLGAKSVVRPHNGSPYRYEAEEAMRCMRLGLAESPDMTLDETVRILAVLDDIRLKAEV